jgi:response regulator RpfG family c-di-GMP phosphodiesterase/serine/threonine protein kinase
MDRTGDYQVLDPLEVPGDVSAGMPTPETFLESLEASRLLSPAEQNEFLVRRPELRGQDTAALVEAFVGHGLLSDYQASRLLAGHTFGLSIGNYRVIDRLGVGGMGVVYKAEHIHMKRTVALKILFLEDDQNPVFLERFRSEMEAMAVLRHPNIALAFDAGEVTAPHAPNRILRYLVMEFVPGKNLEQYVQEHGPLPIVQACDFVRQAACGLRHAHEHGLVHRDMKPSNLLVTPQGHIKVLDFGLARLCRRRCTEAHTMLGTVDYMAPEQARDARSVDIRADIYGLGGILYWLLLGERPFPGDRSVVEELLARQHESPRPLRQKRPEVPLELEAIVCQMMARDPGDRYPTPPALITALNEFLEGYVGSPGCATTPRVREEKSIDTDPYIDLSLCTTGSADPVPSLPRTHRVLIVSPRNLCRDACRTALEAGKLDCLEAGAAADVEDCLCRSPCDLVVIDGQAPQMDGISLCRQLRRQPPMPHFKVVLLAAPGNPEAEAVADCGFHVPDFAVPRAMSQTAWVVNNLLRLKDAEDRAADLACSLAKAGRQLEQAARVHDSDCRQAQDVLIFAMAKMAELRGMESGTHLLRMQQFIRTLAEEAMRLPAFAGQIDADFVRMIERCVVLHDIGKIAIPDHILLKPGRLDPEERLVMESHTVVGAGVLEAVARHHGASLAFLQMGRDIARRHHESWDGTGYPDGLAGDSIPLAARLVTIADAYDALRCKLVYKPGLSHAAARRLMLDSNKGQFDPALLVAFRQCDGAFEQIFEQIED